MRTDDDKGGNDETRVEREPARSALGDVLALLILPASLGLALLTLIVTLALAARRLGGELKGFGRR